MSEILKWKVQIRKGYLDLCILAVIEARGRVYGFDLIETLKSFGLEVKEGTLYPLLNRLSTEGLLKAEWEFKEVSKGHPRKFYSLTARGLKLFEDMKEEFAHMSSVLSTIGLEKEKENKK